MSLTTVGSNELVDTPVFFEEVAGSVSVLVEDADSVGAELLANAKIIKTIDAANSKSPQTI